MTKKHRFGWFLSLNKKAVWRGDEVFPISMLKWAGWKFTGQHLRQGLAGQKIAGTI
jgi:hypothetical protein